MSYPLLGQLAMKNVNQTTGQELDPNNIEFSLTVRN